MYGMSHAVAIIIITVIRINFVSKFLLEIFV